MTPPPLSDEKLRIDAGDELRVLGTELRALVERLELKARDHDLQATLKALEQRLSGARAVVMLASEHEELKRRFLERLLGPDVAQVPKPITACIRLEYGTALKSTRDIPSPETMDAIRLPNPTLKSGLAVIDTPALKSGEPDATMLEYAEQADACILVLNRDHELSEASHDFLCRLPEAGARLEIVVENAEAMNGEERLAARKRLVETLRERCRIEAPRLTLVGSAGNEDDGASFWHGRFATFHSVMMRRGREHWLTVTRTMVADAVAQVGAEIAFELKSATPGQRHARLRLGMKDLEGLRTRFAETGQPEARPAAKNGTLEARQPEGFSHRNGHEDVRNGRNTLFDAPAAEAVLVSLTVPGKAAAIEAENTAKEIGKPIEGEAGAGGLGSHAKRGLFLHFNEHLARWIERASDIPLPRTTGIAMGIVLISLIVWALSPRGFFFGPESGAEWDYRPPTPAQAIPAGTLTRSGPLEELPKPGAAVLPETSRPVVPNIPAVPAAKRRAVRMPLARPIPSGATAGVAPRATRHHHHLLGLGKLWHWVRHDHHRETLSHSKEASGAD